MTWLIIGGTGQLGIALSQELGNRGELFSSWGSGDLNITRGPDVLSAVTSLNPSIIVNCAAWTDVEAAELDRDAAYAVNAQGALNLTIAAKKVGAIFVQISTDYVFSGNSTRPWQENDLRSPISVYGSTKAEGEIAVLNEYAENSYIFRTAWLYSQWGKNFAKTITRIALNEVKEIEVVNDQFGQPTSASDLAIQIVDSLLSKIPFGIYHATNSGECSWFDFAKEIFELNRVSVSRIIPVSSSSFSKKAKRPTYSVLGHDAWNYLPPMRNWKIALRDNFEHIHVAILNEK
jgi:dTDP-4-dehydrorhamnose reductase